MAESTIVKTKRDGTLTFSDLAAANTYTVAFEAGDLTIDIPGPTVSNYLDRGRFTSPPSIRHIDDQPISGSFTAYLRDISDAVDETLFEIIAQSGFVGSTWTSRMGANGEVFTLLLTWDLEGTDHGDVDGVAAPSDHRIQLDHCWVTGSIAEGDPNAITINFTSYELYPTSLT